MLDFYEYQLKARRTAIYPPKYSISYPALGLAEETGEVVGKIKKMMRDNIPLEEQKEKIKAEMGDVLWYLAALAHDCGLSLQTIAEENIRKLNKRALENKLHGEGDDR